MIETLELVMSPTPSYPLIISEGAAELLPIVKNSLFIERVKTWLSRLANGGATEDTIKTNIYSLKSWLQWAIRKNIDPNAPTEIDVFDYRYFLEKECEAQPSTIKSRLSSLRTFYAYMVKIGVLSVNPAEDVKAPRDRRVAVDIKHLTLGEACNLVNAVEGDSLRSLRDIAIIQLMMLEGLRRVEIVRMSDKDLNLMESERGQILVHGKGKDAHIAPRPETVEAIKAYVVKRGPVIPDNAGMPVFVSIDKGQTPRNRLSRIGVNSIVNAYLEKIGGKREGLSCHGLRHTCGYMLQKEFKDPKVIQTVLRHTNLSTASLYAHIDGAEIARYTSKLQLSGKKSEKVKKKDIVETGIDGENGL